MKIGVSPTTNTIYAGSTRKPKNGPEVWVKKEDVTDQAISAVFQWMKDECESGGTGLYQVKYEGVKGRMIFDMRPEKELSDETKWENVKVDALVLVLITKWEGTKDEEQNWEKYHFAKYEDGKVHVFPCGQTSWSTRLEETFALNEEEVKLYGVKNG